MKTLSMVLTSILIFSASVLLASEHKLVDGKVQFAVARVGGYLCWTQKEKSDQIAQFEQWKATSPYIVEDLTPTAFEVRVSTTFKFVNYSAWKDTLDMSNEELRDAKMEIDKENKLKNFKREKDNRK